MSDRPRAFKRKAPSGYKRKIAKLEARVVELEQSLAEAEAATARSNSLAAGAELMQTALTDYIRDCLPCESCPAHETEHCDNRTICGAAIEKTVFARLAAFAEDRERSGY